MAEQFPFQCQSCGYQLYTDYEGFDGYISSYSYLYTCDICGSFLRKTIDASTLEDKILGWSDILSNKLLYDGFFGDLLHIESEKGERISIDRFRLPTDNECPVCKYVGYLKRWNPVKCRCPKCKKGVMRRVPGPSIFTD